MYNRYLRSDEGIYTRIPMPDAPEPPKRHAQRLPAPPSHEEEAFLRRILAGFRRQGADTADLLLLAVLFLLFEEQADDELLLALGLLLIL